MRKKKKTRKNRIMEPPISLPVEETVAELANSNKPPLNSRLADLSNLNSAELEAFEQAWVRIKPKRQRQIMSRLIELAEDNVELNFESILKNRLKDRDPEVRSRAIEGLWECEETSLISPLVNLLEQDRSEKVQVAAATGLGKFAMLAEHKKLRSRHVSRVYQALLTTIDDKSKPIEVRRRALEAAAPLSFPQVKEAIINAYQSRDAKLRVNAIYAMGRNCDYSWLPTLVKELASDDAETRYEAAGACGELEKEEAVLPLIRLTSDPDTDVRLAAIQALGKIGGTEAKEHLQYCLNDPGEVIQQAAEQALQELEARENPLPFRF